MKCALATIVALGCGAPPDSIVTVPDAAHDARDDGGAAGQPRPVDVLAIHPTSQWSDGNGALAWIAADLARELVDAVPGPALALRVGTTIASLGSGPYEGQCPDGGGGSLLLDGSCAPWGQTYPGTCDEYVVVTDEQHAAIVECNQPAWTYPCQSFQQPLESMRRTFDECASFLREGSVLVVLFLAEVDDCSAADWAIWDPGDQPWQCDPWARCATRPELQVPVDEYVEYLTALRPPERLAALVMAPGGEGEPEHENCEGLGWCDGCDDCVCTGRVCDGYGGAGYPTPRLQAFAEALDAAGATARFERQCSAYPAPKVIPEFAESVRALAAQGAP